MAKKQRERSESEHLQALIRSLKSENRNLRKQLSRALKRQVTEPLEPEIAEIESIIVEETYSRCPKCSSKLITTDIGVRTLIKCEKCSYRQSKKK